MGRLVGVAALALLILVGVFIGSAVSQYRPDGSAAPTGAATRMADGSRVRVEVLNGGGVSGVAGAATDLLRERGFDVVFFGNADAFGRDTSLVLDRVGELDAARAVADALGIRNVRSQPDANLYLDVSVVLGTDWQPDADAAGATAAPSRPWWDLRPWFGR